MKRTATGATLAFHWGYIVLPIIILFLSIILAAYFYHLLPVEVAYHFESDGSPDRWLGRGAILLWMLRLSSVRMRIWIWIAWMCGVIIILIVSR